MADLASKKDPLHLRDEQPDYVHDTSGAPDEDDAERGRAAVNGEDVVDSSLLGVEKPVVRLDPEKVREAEREGKGFGT